MKIVQWSKTVAILNGVLVLALAAVAPHAGAQQSGLYRAQTFQALIADHRARRIGDSVVVLVYESASATNATDIKVNKSSDLSLSASDGHSPIADKLSAASNGAGGGVETRSGQVLARVSANVVGINDNGEYLIQGRQRIALNNESQVITVSGRVRPQDIDTDNTVLSTRIADAEIEFIGQGLLSAREKPGLLARLFNWLF